MPVDKIKDESLSDIKQYAEKYIPEPFRSWLSDLNNALNVLKSNKYDTQSIGYAEQLHSKYHKEIDDWYKTQPLTVSNGENKLSSGNEHKWQDDWDMEEQGFLNEESSNRVAEDILKAYFDAGYDYRSSLTPEVIAEFGEHSQPDFKEFKTQSLTSNGDAVEAIELEKARMEAVKEFFEIIRPCHDKNFNLSYVFQIDRATMEKLNKQFNK